ncbi:DNA (cytosine-5-)-methyltransferase [Prevotella sp. KH2C16]|uniref:DNA (cytosine-5-)-methyltransferase n=1 Tax=Prevotella sp. KH2C16 TaxID=1855325 RepID=UPI0008ED8CA6|nr:DNA (cytosine-5-)-methyltransferase [Prevotella sp. KH2C16]SFG75368.1 DNA (cytosine-5)-methyltransferase 3A [Prevotella sp. KH2C16]
MVVLSLFDGHSCGQIALRELGVPVERYYASEVDRFAIQNTMHNFPDTIQLGDIRNVDGRKLGRIDLLIGGSPCQSFSFSGKRNGMTTVEHEEVTTLERYMDLKSQGFEFEGQSYLFWEYVRILHEVREANPDVFFLLENVEMGAKWEGVLSSALGIMGVHINAALVSAQNRRRIYWTNIRTRRDGLFGELVSDIPQPEDRGLVLRDVLEREVPERYYLKESVARRILSCWKSATAHVPERKMSPIKVGGGWAEDLVLPYDDYNHRFPEDNGKVGAVRQTFASSAEGNGFKIVENHFRIRRITPTECARLQTVPDWYEWVVSETQQYRLLGNGWCVEVIKHIFSFLPKDMFNRQKQ